MKLLGGFQNLGILSATVPAFMLLPDRLSDIGRAVSRLSRENGQALIEFAFIVPLLFLFILIAVDFGIALDRREVIQHAVREGARRGAVGDTVAQIMEETHNQSKGTLANDVDHIAVCFVDSNGNGLADPGENVRVSGNYTYRFSIGGGEMLAAFGVGAPSIDMSPSAEERLEKTAAIPDQCH
jgi:hypothetical protein